MNSQYLLFFENKELFNFPKYLNLNSNIKPIIKPISKIIIVTKTFCKIFINSILSSHLFEVSEKQKDYKIRNTNHNYLRILNSHIKNSFFSNTNYNFVDYSLNKFSLEVAE